MKKKPQNKLKIEKKDHKELLLYRLNRMLVVFKIAIALDKCILKKKPVPLNFLKNFWISQLKSQIFCVNMVNVDAII